MVNCGMCGKVLGEYERDFLIEHVEVCRECYRAHAPDFAAEFRVPEPTKPKKPRGLDKWVK